VLVAGIGTPLVGAEVTVRGPDGQTRTTQTENDGTWFFEDLPIGVYHLVAHANLFEKDQTDESVDPGKATQITFRLFPEAAEEVTVKGNRPPREVTKETITEEEINRHSRTGRRRDSIAPEPPRCRAPPGRCAS